MKTFKIEREANSYHRLKKDCWYKINKKIAFSPRPFEKNIGIKLDPGKSIKVKLVSTKTKGKIINIGRDRVPPLYTPYIPYSILDTIGRKIPSFEFCPGLFTRCTGIKLKPGESQKFRLEIVE